jgi:hypothetical protein
MREGKPNAVVRAEAMLKRCNGLARRFPRGLRSVAREQRVHPGTWETPWTPRRKKRTGHRKTKVQACGRQGPTTRGSEETDTAAVPPSEGNEAKREG